MSYTWLREAQGFHVAKTNPLLRKPKDSVLQKLHIPWESTQILSGKSYTSIGKAQGFCMAQATPSMGKQIDSLWQKPHLP